MFGVVWRHYRGTTTTVFHNPPPRTPPPFFVNQLQKAGPQGTHRPYSPAATIVHSFARAEIHNFEHSSARYELQQQNTKNAIQQSQVRLRPWPPWKLNCWSSYQAEECTLLDSSPMTLKLRLKYALQSRSVRTSGKKTTSAKSKSELPNPQQYQIARIESKV